MLRTTQGNLISPLGEYALRVPVDR
jgi:hypothetical protein